MAKEVGKEEKKGVAMGLASEIVSGPGWGRESAPEKDLESEIVSGLGWGRESAPEKG